MCQAGRRSTLATLARTTRALQAKAKCRVRTLATRTTRTTSTKARALRTDVAAFFALPRTCTSTSSALWLAAKWRCLQLTSLWCLLPALESLLPGGRRPVGLLMAAAAGCSLNYWGTQPLPVPNSAAHWADKAVNLLCLPLLLHSCCFAGGGFSGPCALCGSAIMAALLRHYLLSVREYRRGHLIASLAHHTLFRYCAFMLAILGSLANRLPAVVGLAERRGYLHWPVWAVLPYALLVTSGIYLATCLAACTPAGRERGTVDSALFTHAYWRRGALTTATLCFVPRLCLAWHQGSAALFSSSLLEGLGVVLLLKVGGRLVAPLPEYNFDYALWRPCASGMSS